MSGVSTMLLPAVFSVSDIGLPLASRNAAFWSFAPCTHTLQLDTTL